MSAGVVGRGAPRAGRRGVVEGAVLGGEMDLVRWTEGVGVSVVEAAEVVGRAGEPGPEEGEVVSVRRIGDADGEADGAGVALGAGELTAADPRCALREGAVWEAIGAPSPGRLAVRWTGGAGGAEGVERGVAGLGARWMGAPTGTDDVGCVGRTAVGLGVVGCGAGGLGVLLGVACR